MPMPEVGPCEGSSQLECFQNFFAQGNLKEKIKSFKNNHQNLFFKHIEAMLTGMNQPNDSLKRSFFFPLETIKGYENI